MTSRSTYWGAALGCLLWDKRKGRPVVLKACALFCSAAIALVLRCV